MLLSFRGINLEFLSKQARVSTQTSTDLRLVQSIVFIKVTYFVSRGNYMRGQVWEMAWGNFVTFNGKRLPTIISYWKVGSWLRLEAGGCATELLACVGSPACLTSGVAPSQRCRRLARPSRWRRFCRSYRSPTQSRLSSLSINGSAHRHTYRVI